MVPARTLSSAEDGSKSIFCVKVEPRELEEVKDAAGLSNASEENVSSIFDPLINPTTLDDFDPSSIGLKIVDDDVEGEEVDVINCSGSAEIHLVKSEDPDVTECSSSFGESFESDSEPKQEEWSDFEAESPFPASNGDPTINDGFSVIFKKKKLTTEWRKYVSPLMWRCQWIELHLKDLKLRASKYDKELASYKREKDLKSKMVELDSSVSRSVPVAYQRNYNKVMRRRRRKRSEEKIDISSYASNHVFFSYYENKRTETDGHSVDDDCGDVAAEDNIKRNDDNQWLCDTKGNDCRVEQLLLNIDTIQSRVFKLKANLNKVMCRNIKEISSSHDNLLSLDVPASYVHSASGSPRNNGDAMITGILTPPHHVSEYDMGDVMTESAVSSFGDAADLDIIESTIGILARDVVLGQHHVEDLCRNSADDVLIDNQIAEEEYRSLEKLDHATGSVQVSFKKEETHSEDESNAPDVAILRPATTSRATSLQTVLKLGSYTGKRRGRKPKKRRRGTPVVVAGPSGSGGPWRSERLLKKRRLQRIKRT